MRMEKFFNIKTLWILIFLVILTGLFIPPLMGNDAPEYATIALRMHRDHDYVNIINRDYDYLDKPHLLFWSAALSYKLFGVHDWSYRLISVIICLMGAYATFRLGKKLYTTWVGHLAAIIFITSQAILLGMHDVRTDALLTGLTIIALWQLVEFIDRQRLINILIGASALALAVGTKGMIAVLVTGCCLFFYVLGKKAWSNLLTWKVAAGVAMFIIMLLPFLYCYYLQFDLHPEKLVNGAYGVSGIKFLLWTQSFERLTANHPRGSTNPEFIFLYHSFLWSFLPWVVIALGAWADRVRDFFKNGIKGFFTKEQLTFLGTFVAFNIMSLSQFKLPHYMNLLFPMIAIGTAAFFYDQLNATNKLWRNIFRVSQYVIIVVLFIAAVLLHAWVFPANSIIATLAIIMLALLVISLFKSPDAIYGKLWIPSTIGILAFNFLLNTNFYPQLAKYQAGSTLAAQLEEQGIDREKIVTFNYIFRSFDFYSGWISPQLSEENIVEATARGDKFFVIVNERGKQALQKLNIPFRERIKTPDIPITRLKGKFLNPATRESTLKYGYLVEIN